MDAGPRPLLESLTAALRDVDLEAFLKLGQGPVPDQIFVALDPDAGGRGLHLQLMFLPGLDDPAVLQYYVGLPYPVDPDADEALCRFLCALNVTLPVSGFGYHAPEALLFFRHTHAAAVAPLDPDVVLWTLTTVEFLVGHFGPLVEAVAAGLPLEKAEARLADELTDLVAAG